MQDKLMEINTLFKELEYVYREYAKYCNLSEAAVWILYALRYENKELTQKDLCDIWCFKKQTVNSALRVLQNKAYVILESFEDNKKNKKIVLTKLGLQYMEDHLDNIIRSEQKVLSLLTDDEYNALITVGNKYSSLLKGEIDNLLREDLSKN